MEISKLLQADVTLCLAILVTCTVTNYLMTRPLLSRENNQKFRDIIKIIEYNLHECLQ